MTDLVTSRTLADLADQLGAAPVVLIDGVEAVVLGRTSSGAVAVYRAGNLHEFPHDDVSVVAITATDERLDVMERAVRDLARWREAAATTAGELRALLPRIRAYAIERHRSGDICRDGLNRFLREFDLPEYQPYMTVHYTITGSFQVDGDDEDKASNQLDALSVHVSSSSEIDNSSLDYSVSLDEVDMHDGEDNL